MSLRKAWFILPCVAAVAALVAFFVMRGRGGGAASGGPASEEAEQREYYARLKEKRAERLPLASERVKTAKAMEAIIAEARNALVAGGVESPTDEQLKSEIEGHPERYPAWKELHAKMVELNSEFSAKLSEAQGVVRERMKRTGADVPGPAKAKQ